MTILTVINNVQAGLTLPLSASVVGSDDETALQMLKLANDEGRVLARRYEWQALQTEKTFTATATETQTGAVPSDFDRIINESFFNRTRKRIVQGPLSSPAWQYLKSVIASTVWDSYRIRGNDMLISPVPSAGDVYAFEYITKNWVSDAGTPSPTYRATYQADTDVARLDEWLIELGVRWRWLQAKGLPYQEDFATYEREVYNAMTKDGGKEVLNVGLTTDFGKPRSPIVQEGSWDIL